MRTFLTLIVSLLLLSATTPAPAVEVPAEAYAVGAVDGGDPRAETRLIVDHDSVAVGDTVRVGVLFDMDPEWHVYGEDPGEAGLPTSIIWRAEGGEVGELIWPATQTFVDPSGRITTTGYAERVVLEAPATVATGDVFRVSAEIDYLVCRIKCLPGSSKLVREIPIGASKPASDEVLALFDNFGKNRPNDAGEVGTTVSNPAAADSEEVPMWQALLLALLGGMLLNLMPCVFPVLALKVFGFVSTAGHRPTALRHSAAYAAGVIGSMLLLATAVVGVKLGGEAVGWGFQFQSPEYLAALTLFMVVFALNLFGVFDVQSLPLPSSAGEVSIKRSVIDGALAVVLATPCSAPFLGTAVGFALGSGPLEIYGIFLCVGLGLALPFVAACAIPGLGERLPQPGQWMEDLERVLGFVLLGTAVWLLWVFGRVAGIDAVAVLLGCTVAAALGAWLFGRFQYAGPNAQRVGLAVAIALVIIPAALLQPWSFASEVDGWQQWDEARIGKEQAAGKVVFVDFTADWCITCKVNERAALSSDEIWQMFEDNNVVAMKADWTQRNEPIRKALAKFGRAGVPMYLVYPPNGGEPEVLPEVLTESIVTAAIARSLRTSGAQ